MYFTPKATLAAAASILVLAATVTAQTQSNPHAPVVRKSTATSSDIDWGKSCGGECAAGRQPRYYKFVDQDSVYAAVGEVLQQVGFGLNPKGMKPKENVFDPEAKKDGSRFFWTDLIPLDDAMLKKFGTTRAALKLSDDPGIFYAVQIAFTCDAHNPLIEAARQDPKLAMQDLMMSESGAPGVPFRSARTEVDFAFSLLLKKRAQKSTYVDDSSEYDNGPILDWLYKKISDRINSLKPDLQMDAETGGVLG